MTQAFKGWCYLVFTFKDIVKIILLFFSCAIIGFALGHSIAIDSATDLVETIVRLSEVFL